MTRSCTVLPFSAEFQFADRMHSLPQAQLDGGRDALLTYFENTWSLTEMLFRSLRDDAAFYRRPHHQLRHPMIFYYAHPVVLYVNKLRVAGLIDGPVRADFEALFETGVDEMRWDDLHEGREVWPPLSEVRAYRQQVYALVRSVIERSPLLASGQPPITQASPLWALVMGFEHERIHLETSSVLLRELPIECVQKPEGWPEFHSSPRHAAQPENAMIALPASEVTLGKPDNIPTFGWDNEYGGDTRAVRPFSASRYCISNGEFHAFVIAGGYAERRFWSDEGWAWRQFRNAKWPAFWVPHGPAGLHEYRLRTVFEIVDMPWSWPVCVNFHEAKAYCAWRTEKETNAMPYRLPTEAEHHAMRDGAAPEANLNLRTGGESPVDAFPANAKGFHDVSGNVWQWCEDHFHPLTGAKPHPYYEDFSTPCYDGEHQMMLGGSFISTGDEASAFARFHFRPHFFQHAGFRLARSEDGNPACDAVRLGARGGAYETSEMLHQYMLMHWGSEAEIYDGALHATPPRVAHLPLACAALVTRFAVRFERALDLGCAVGRASFELARDFQDVTGIDHSHAFIAAADALRRSGELSYSRKDSGAVRTALAAQVDPAIRRERLRFNQGDACALPPDMGEFDAVLLANVLCRLPDPHACLARLPSLVRRGGVLVMTTPFSWLEAYTPRSRWITDIGALRPLMPEFELLHCEDIPFLIREHARKFEYIVTQASVWRRI